MERENGGGTFRCFWPENVFPYVYDTQNTTENTCCFRHRFYMYTSNKVYDDDDDDDDDDDVYRRINFARL